MQMKVQMKVQQLEQIQGQKYGAQINMFLPRLSEKLEPVPRVAVVGLMLARTIDFPKPSVIAPRYPFMYLTPRDLDFNELTSLPADIFAPVPGLTYM